ncbi:flavin reductase family protein [Enterococcus sp. AZ109]|uniref:flavin reductase family protein n=1 Tax=Enterococcus sp. AZ109 TaxID=2774634 RepID=UPI003F20C54F
MIHYSSNQLTTKQNYKFLTGSIIPRPIAWITTVNPETKIINAAPFSYFNVVAKNVPLVSVSINRQPDEQMKDTANNLLKSHEGVVHLIDDSVLHEMNATSASLPADIGELTDSQLTLIDSRSIQVPAIKEAPIRMEARLHQYLEIKDHEEQVISDFFILEIIDYYFSEEVFDIEKEYILPEKLSPIARLAGDSYSHINNIVDIKRPK